MREEVGTRVQCLFCSYLFKNVTKPGADIAREILLQNYFSLNAMLLTNVCAFGIPFHLGSSVNAPEESIERIIVGKLGR